MIRKEWKARTPRMDPEKEEARAFLRFEKEVSVWKDPDPEMTRLMAEAGMLDEKMRLTEKGMERLAEIKERLSLLKRGIPFSTRTFSNHRRIIREPGPEWRIVPLGNKKVFTNGELLYVGRPEEEMLPKAGCTSIRTKIRRWFLQQTGVFHEVRPAVFQTDGTPEEFNMELVWLRNEDCTVWVPIQAKYYDFIMYRQRVSPSKKATAIFYASAEEGKAVKVRSMAPRWGLTEENIFALIHPVIGVYPPIGGDK